MKTSTESQFDILTSQQIDELHPGAILADFQTLLEFIGTDGIKTGGKYYRLPLASLNDLDGRMTHPLRPKLKRPQQLSFPHLNGLYLLLRSSGLGVTSGQGTTGRLSIHPDRFAEWEELNPEERYFTLFQAMLESEWSVIEEGRRGYGPWQELGWGMDRWTQRWKVNKSVPTPASEVFISWRDQTVAALLELFGILLIPRVKQQEGENWRVGPVCATDFGAAFLTRLRDPSMLSAVLDFTDRSTVGEQRWVGEMFREYFPNCVNTLKEDEGESVDGLWQFKVSLGKAWRRFVIPADLTVDDLIGAILNAFDFDNDHLYELRFRDRSGRNVTVGHPMLDEVDHRTDEYAVGYLPLDPGQSMEFHFDFGDDWRFAVTLEEILPPDERVTAPKCVAKRGKAPEQYPAYDDGEW